MEGITAFFGAELSVRVSFGCISCNREVQEQLYNDTFLPNLAMMFSPFIILGLLTVLFSYLSTRKHRRFIAANRGSVYLNPVPLSTASMVLGIGLGGFTDGIVFHQILQWHEMISNRIPPDTLDAKTVNMFWDGIFHAFTFIVTVTGCVLLWKLLHRKYIDRSGRLFIGGLLMGWGIFNIVEGLINHHILELHFVKDISPHVDLWNYGFLAGSVFILIIGFFLSRKTPSVSGGAKA